MRSVVHSGVTHRDKTHTLAVHSAELGGRSSVPFEPVGVISLGVC